MKRSYFITAISLLGAGLIALAVGLAVPFLQMQTVDIIGGAGYSTYQFLLFNANNGVWCILAHLGGAMVLSGSFGLVFRKTVANNCTRTTSLLALALSVMGSAGFVCVLLAWETLPGYHVRYPYANSTAIGAGVICLLACLVLLGVYFVKWSQKGTWKGLLFDCLLTVVCFPTFFGVWNELSHALWNLLKDVI